MDLASFGREESNPEKISKKFAEIETQLRRQMILGPKRLLIALPLSLPATSMHLESAAKLVSPFHLLLAVASVGVCWFYRRWWKGKALGGAEN